MTRFRAICCPLGSNPWLTPRDGQVGLGAGIAADVGDCRSGRETFTRPEMQSKEPIEFRHIRIKELYTSGLINAPSIPVTSKTRGRDSLLVRRRPGQAGTETGIMPLWAWAHLDSHSTLADGAVFPDLEISCHFTRKARQNDRALASLKTGRRSRQRTGSSPLAARRA